MRIGCILVALWLVGGKGRQGVYANLSANAPRGHPPGSVCTVGAPAISGMWKSRLSRQLFSDKLLVSQHNNRWFNECD
jgi:hypothetical protein